MWLKPMRLAFHLVLDCAVESFGALPLGTVDQMKPRVVVDGPMQGRRNVARGAPHQLGRFLPITKDLFLRAFGNFERVE